MPLGVSIIRLQQWSANILGTPLSTAHLFYLGNVLMEPYAIFIGHVFRGEGGGGSIQKCRK